jgi:MFS transporter, Spinster family, sphingosine-1-phosphate transporter
MDSPAAKRFSAAPASSASHATLALTLLTILNLVNYLDRYVLPGVQPLIQQDFHLSDDQVGALSSAFFFVYMFAAPLIGWMGDRWSRKPLLIAGGLIWSVATLFTATVHTYHELFFRHAIVGIGEASFCIFAPSLLSDLYRARDRNRVLSIFYVAIPVGAALGYLIGGMLGQRYGWRNPFYVAAVPGFIATLLFWWKVPEPARGGCDVATDSAAKPSPPIRSALVGLFRNYGYQLSVLGMAMMTFSIGGISIWMPTFLHRNAGYSLSHAGFALGVITAIDGIAGTWMGGWLAQRWLRTNHRALFLLSALSVLLAIPGALLAFFGPQRFVLPGVALAEFFLFLNTGPLNTAIVNSVSATIRSTALAIELFLIHALGDVPSPKLIGWVSDRTNLSMGLGLTLIAMAISAIALFAGARFAAPLADGDPHPAAATA